MQAPPSKTDAGAPRLVVFGPGLTALVFEMGFGKHVVGVDQYSRPPAGEERPVVGSALAVRVEPILAVKPDVLLVNMDPRQFEPVTRVDPRIRVEHFDLFRLEDVEAAMDRIGRIVGEPKRGRHHADAFRLRLERLRERAARLERPKVLFVLGHQSPLGPGRGDFVDDMIALVGGENVLASRHEGWKRVTLEMVADLDPRVILCQCDEGSADEAKRYWEAVRAPPGSPPRRVVVLTDPRWTLPAAHLAVYAEKLAEIVHPEFGLGGGASSEAPQPGKDGRP